MSKPILYPIQRPGLRTAKLRPPVPRPDADAYGVGKQLQRACCRSDGWVGVDKVLRMAHRMGITSLEDNTVGLQLTLGGGEVKVD